MKIGSSSGRGTVSLHADDGREPYRRGHAGFNAVWAPGPPTAAAHFPQGGAGLVGIEEECELTERPRHHVVRGGLLIIGCAPDGELDGAAGQDLLALGVAEGVVEGG
ncbi:hypothetical protein [Streptomyces cremeus]|uniref:Uncharacterized protein n=1 Tax=Streptomyces cremeus TaxID=66881 RepID=A0ABV5P5S3_STRCM